MRNAILSSGLIRPEELADLARSIALGSGRMLGGKATDTDLNYLGVGEPPPNEPDPNERNLRASLAGLAYS